MNAETVGIFPRYIAYNVLSYYHHITGNENIYITKVYATYYSNEAKYSGTSD